jgi:hypothetical protein
MHIIYFVLFLISVCISAVQAQITITSQDIGDAGVKVAYKTFRGTLPLGNAAADQTWDYSNQAQLPVTDTTEFLNPSSTLYAGRFPQANMAIVENGLLSFYRKANNGLFLEGIVLDVGGLIDETPIFRISPALRIIQFPSTFGTTFNLNASSRFSFRYDTVVTIPVFGNPVEVNVDSVRIIATFTGTSAMNGWGNLILPPGTSFPSLRQQINQTTTFSVEVRALIPVLGPRWVAFPIGLPSLTNNSIRYWTNGKNNSMLEITLDSANRPLNARFQPPTITSLEASNSFNQPEVFPNPFTNTLHISGLDEQFAKGQLLTVDGKVVATTSTVDFSQSSLSVLRPGVYLLQLSDKTGVIRKRLKVMKE